jgi:dienelactone hydrolase
VFQLDPPRAVVAPKGAPLRVRPLHLASAVIATVAILSASPFAAGPKEIPPPQGKGRVVVVSSGASGPDHYETVSRAIAALGYDVVLFDGNAMEGTKGAALKDAIPQALQMPHAIPGKVALVGFSLGGAVSLGYGPLWPDQVAVVIVWYPATSVFKDIPGFASRLAVPVLMFAGESDTYKDCCLIATARTIGAAAAAAGKPFDLFTYPKTDHDFVQGGSHYNPAAYKDAFDKTAAKLKEFLGG